jgi:hypothetical protein
MAVSVKKDLMKDENIKMCFFRFGGGGGGG